MKTATKKNSEWVVGTDDVGQATLKWSVDPAQQQAESDPFERTYDFLRRLDVDGLSLERERTPPRTSDPYNSTGFKGRRTRVKR
ncbi:MAG TPA: hypothetical protein VIC71_11820 [Gammaproteobacteria bacterium]